MVEHHGKQNSEIRGNPGVLGGQRQEQQPDPCGFNEHYGSALTEAQLIKISCGGMSNSGPRGIRICSNVGDQVDIVLYNETETDDTATSGTIAFQNQYLDGKFTSVLVTTGLKKLRDG